MNFAAISITAFTFFRCSSRPFANAPKIFRFLPRTLLVR